MTLTFKKPSKKVIALITGAIAVAMVMVGTFAWNSFNQSRINVFNEIVEPDVNLHDDFEGGPNKDVYVENSGQKDIFVRVRLTEYLETVAKGSLVLGHLRGTEDTEAELARTWSAHNGLDTCETCKLIETDQVSPEWAPTDTFHTYYKWLMGGKDTPNGQIYYKPATPEQKGEYAEDGTVVRSPVVVSDPLTGTSALGDAHLEYAAEVARLMADGMLEDAAMEELGIKKTQKAFVITMSQWESGNYTKADGTTPSPYELGDFWIIDEEDGWCYWANPLKAGQATGLLLDKVERTNVPFESNSEYCINAWLQAIDFDDVEMARLSGNGGMSANGNKLMQLAGGSAFIDASGAVYKYDKISGTYTMTFEADGTEVPDNEQKAFVPMGASTNLSAADTNKLFIGDRFTITELVWDGDTYTNYGSIVAGPNDLYNITKAEGATNDVLELVGTVIGRDGVIYLEVANVTSDSPDLNNTFYIASVKETAGTPKTYSQDYPGTGPFGFVYSAPNSTLIGTANDLRSDPSIAIGGNPYYHLGNGVYVKVATLGDKTSVEPTVYYFAGKILSKATDGAKTAEQAFPVSIEKGALFDMTTEPLGSNPVRTSVKTFDPLGDDYKLTDIVIGENGQLYIQVTGTGTDAVDEGYISIGSDKYLGNAGDLRVWAGLEGKIGTSSDKLEMPSDFTEQFLKNQGITKSSKLKEPGDTFVADNIEWVLLAVDDYGNRLIATKETQGNSAFGSNNTYSSSTLATTMKTFYNTKMPSVKPYVQDAFIPAMDLKSRALPSQTAATAFALGFDEIKAYVQSKAPATVLEGVAWTRTATGSNVYAVNADGTSTNGSTGVAANTSNAYRPAVWVKFSDADKIADTREGALSFLSNNFTGAAGQTFIADGVEWLVLEKDGSGNMLILATQSVNTINQGAVAGYMATNNNLRNWINSTYYASKMPTLRNYVKLSNANTALDSGTTSNQARQDTAAYSKVITSGDGLYVFVLSQSEYNKHRNTLIGKSPLNIVWTRSTGGSATTFTYVTGENATNNTLTFAFGGNTAARQVCPAMWVNFGPLS